MAMSSTRHSTECPLCHDDFKDPKILLCGHIVCKQCVLSRLNKKRGEAGCPVCRAPIMSSANPNRTDIEKEVRALPTNHAVVALVESRQVLTSPHTCKVCDHAKAKSYCRQCDIKLCKGCVKGHTKIPATKNHNIEDLNNLTIRRVAETNRSMCKAHPDRLAELFCPAHKEVICLMCASTKHESCTGKKSIADAAEENRAKLKDRASALKKSRDNLTKKIETANDFKALRSSVNDTFNDIQKTLDARKLEVERKIQAQEDEVIKSHKSAYDSQASNTLEKLEQLVNTAPQAALLAMVADLTSRLDQLQSQTATTTAGQLQVPEFTVDVSTLRKLKSDISSLGHFTLTPQTKAKPMSSQWAWLSQTGLSTQDYRSSDEDARTIRSVRENEDPLDDTLTWAAGVSMKNDFPTPRTMLGGTIKSTTRSLDKW